MSNQETPATLADTQAIEHFMTSFGQPVYREPQEEPPLADRVLRGRLVLEEAFELIEALGLKVSFNEGEVPVRVNPKSVTLHEDNESGYDIIEVGDALADLIVVTKGAGAHLGLPVDEIVLDEVMPSNMSKLDDGKVLRDEGGKILKGKDFFEPNIKRIIDRYRPN